MDSSGKLIDLSSWHCNLILNEFNNLEKILKHRRKISNIYKNNIDKNLLSEEIIKNIHLSSNLRFPIFAKNRENLISYLRQKSIYLSDIWYDAPIAPKKYLNLTDYKNQCPNSEEISSRIVNLPTHINISEKDALCISKEVNKWLKLQ